MDYEITKLDPDGKYIMYLRKSRADSPEETVEEVLAKHERMLQELSIRLLGRRINNEDIYREVGSGETIEDRHEIKVVLSAIESPLINGVFVVDPQRLSRGDWEDGGRILSNFKYSNTLIVTPTKIFNLHKKMDYDYFKMELSRGNDYLEYQKLILNRGKLDSVNQGNYIGSVAPFGFKKVIVDKSHTLEEYEPESKIIKIAIKLRIDNNWGWNKVAHELDRLRLSPRHGGYWSPYTLKDICTNPVNIGLIRWNGRKTVKVFEDGNIKVTRPRNKDVLYIKGKHPAIIEKEMFDKLISMQGKTTREKVSKELVNPFAGLLYCGTCGKAMTYRTYKHRDGSFRSSPRLLCNNQVHCHTKSCEFSYLYQSVIDTLESIVADFEIHLKEDKSSSTYELQQKMINDIKKDLDKLEERQNDLYDLLEDKTYTREVFLKRNKKLADERNSLKERLQYLTNNIVKPINYEEKIFMFNDVIKALKDDHISAKEKNTLLKSIIERIDYYVDSTNKNDDKTNKPILKIKLIDFN